MYVSGLQFALGVISIIVGIFVLIANKDIRKQFFKIISFLPVIIPLYIIGALVTIFGIMYLMYLYFGPTF